jgi:hypothetical protein
MLHSWGVEGEVRSRGSRVLTDLAQESDPIVVRVAPDRAVSDRE